MAVDAHDADMARLSDLIGAIYDCVLDPSRWEATLDDLRQLLQCANCVLSVVDMRRGVRRTQKIVGIEPYWRQRMDGYAADVAAIYKVLPTRPLDEPFIARQDVPDGVLLSNRYWREWAVPQSAVDVIQIFLMRDSERNAILALDRHESIGLITKREVRLMRLLAPHVRRAVTICDLIDMKSLETGALTDTLDAFAVGVVLVAADGEILHANRPAANMLDRGAPIARVGGKLQTADMHVTQRLRRIVAHITAGNESRIGGSGIGMALGGSSGDVATAHILPLARGDVRTRLLPRAAAAVFVASDLRLPFARLDAVAEAFGLTHAETRLLGRLARGETLAEAAAAMNVAITTARTHCSRLLSKTGMRRQTNLISLVHRLVPSVAAVQTAPADTDSKAELDRTESR